MIASLLPRVVAASCRRPWLVLLAGALLTFLSIVYASGHFAMSTDTSALISPDVDWRRDEAVLDRAFPQNGDVTLVVIDSKTPELAEAGAAALAAILAKDQNHFRSVTRPDGGPFFARNGLLFATPEEVRATTARLIDAQPLIGPLASDPSLRGVMNALDTIVGGIADGRADAARITRPIKALADALDPASRGKPAYFSWQNLLSDGGGALAPPTRRLILVRPHLDYDTLMPGAASSDAIRQAAAKLSLDPAHGTTIRLTGSVPLSDEEFASLADKAWLVGGAIVAAMLLTLWLATRSIRTVSAILLTTLVGLIVTTAVGLAIVGRLNLISVAFIPLFVGLGVDFGIQLSIRFGAERRSGRDPAGALVAAAHALGPSLLLAATAVCLGFFAFLPTAYIGISELGIIAGLGMIIALGFSVTLLPVCLLLFRPSVPSAEVGFRALAPMDRFLVQRRVWVLCAFALSMLGSIALLPLVSFDFNPLHLRDVKGEAMATLADLTRDPDRTPNTVDILAADAPSAARIARNMAALPQVRQVVTLDSFVPGSQDEKLATIADARGLLDLTLNPFVIAPAPTDSETIVSLRAAAATLRRALAIPDATRLTTALDRLAAGSADARARAQSVLVQPLAIMLDQLRLSLQASSVTRATLPPDLVHEWVASDGRTRVQLFPAGDTNDNSTLERFTEAVRLVAPHASGPPISTQAAAGTIAHAFIQAGVLALIAVSLLLFAVLRNVREVAFTLAPVVLSGFLTLGTCVLIGQSINFANIIAFPLLFGVGTAFHIYFVMAWRGGATDLLQSPLARAILFSAFATGSAFGSLWLSSHPGTASMGKILMISLAWTLVCALIFEPALLGKANRSPASAKSLPD